MPRHDDLRVDNDRRRLIDETVEAEAEDEEEAEVSRPSRVRQKKTRIPARSQSVYSGRSRAFREIRGDLNPLS